MNFRSSRSMAFYVKGYLAMVLMTWVVGQSWGLKPELKQFECKPEESCRYIFRRNALKNKPLYCYFGDDVEIKRKDVCPQENLCHKNVYHDDIDRSGKRVRAILFPNPVCGTKPVCESLSNTSFRRNDGSDVYDGYWKCQGGTRVNNVGPYTSCVPKCINGKVLERDFYVRCNESLLWEGLQTPRCVDKGQKNDNLRPPNVTVKVTSPNTLNIIVAPLDETKNVKYYRVVVTDPFSTYSRMLPWNQNLFHVHNLTCDRYHNISVVMILESGEEIPAPLQTVKTPSFIPEAPVSVNATRPNKTCVNLRWSPATNNSGIVRGYNITYQGGWKQTTGLQMEICGLRPDSDVCFFIQPYTFSTVGKATEICPPVVDVQKDSKETEQDINRGYIIIGVLGGLAFICLLIVLCCHRERIRGFCKQLTKKEIYGSPYGSNEISESSGSSNSSTKSSCLLFKLPCCKKSLKSKNKDDKRKPDVQCYKNVSEGEQTEVLSVSTGETDCSLFHSCVGIEHYDLQKMEDGKDRNYTRRNKRQTRNDESPSVIHTVNQNEGEDDSDDDEDASNLSYKAECKPLFVQHDIPQRQSTCEVMENEAPVQNNFECDTNYDLAAAPVLNINSLKNPPRTDSAADEPIIFASDELPSLLSSPSFHEEMMSQSEDDNKDSVPLQKMNSNYSFSKKYQHDQKIPKLCDFNKYDTPSELRLSLMEEGYKEKPNMAQPADHDDGKTRCTVTIQNFMDHCEKAVEVLTKLGYKLDPDNLNPAKTWKGFAKAKLNYDDDRVNATAHHTKGNPNNGHFMSLLDDMLASGITLGDIVEYFSMEESRRDDVLGLIFDYHPSCPFCDRYRKLLQDI